MQSCGSTRIFYCVVNQESQAPKPKAKRNPGTPKPSSHSLNHDQFTLGITRTFFSARPLFRLICNLSRGCAQKVSRAVSELGDKRWEHLWLL